MKKKILSVISIMCIMSLCACGETVATGTGSGKNSKDVTVVSASVTDGANSEISQGDTQSTAAASADAGENPENGTTLPGVPKKYMEYLGNPDDETYFKPKTDDWVVWMKKDSVDIRITLLSFDETGTIVQYTERRVNADGSKVITKTQDGQYKSADEMVFYQDFTSSSNYMENLRKYQRVSDKFSIFNTYGDKLYASKGLFEEETRRLNSDDPDYQELCAVGDLFGSDYYIELGDVSSHDAFIPDGVFGYDAFSYRHGELYCYDEKGKCTKFCEIILLDDAAHIDAYNMCFYGTVHDKAWTYIKLDEENYNKYVKTKNIKYMGRIIYMDFNDKSISSNEKKVTRLTNSDGYFSKPYLTESQIETIYKK